MVGRVAAGAGVAFAAGFAAACGTTEAGLGATNAGLGVTDAGFGAMAAALGGLLAAIGGFGVTPGGTNVSASSDAGGASVTARGGGAVMSSAPGGGSDSGSGGGPLLSHPDSASCGMTCVLSPSPSINDVPSAAIVPPHLRQRYLTIRPRILSSGARKLALQLGQ